MNYLEWNNAIINHFFSHENEEKEVILYFNEDLIKEIGEENFHLPEKGYLEDFFIALKKGVWGISNNDYIKRILDLEYQYSLGCRKIDNDAFNYPPYLSYILAFLLPFTSGQISEGFRMSNFHDIVKQYFESKQLTSNYVKEIKFRLVEIDHLWDSIFNWLFESNNLSLGYIERIDNPIANRKYVSKFEYHIIFRKEQEDKLSEIFDNNNILPNEPIDENKIKQLLIENAKDLHLTNDIVAKIRNDEYIGKKLVKRALKYYRNWNGTNKIDYSKTTAEATKQRGFSRKRIVICLNFDLLSQRIEIKHFRIYSIDGFPENFTLIDAAYKEYISVEQSSQNPLYSTAITECFQNLIQSLELKDNANRIKYTWKAKEFYIFKRDSQLKDWVEIPQIEFNVGKTLIVAKKTFYDNNLKLWFEAESIPAYQKKLYSDNTKNQLPDEWLALTVEHITNYQHPTLQNLKTSPEITPKINFHKEFFFDGCFYSDILPNVWVENYEIESGDLIAEYKDGSKINLCKQDNLNLFQFTEEHLKRKSQEFKLKFSHIEYPRFIKVIDFDKKKTNEEITQIQPKRDLIGNTIKSFENTTDSFQGIEHCFTIATIQRIKPTQRNPVTGECIFINKVDAISFNQNYNYDKTHVGNILVNYISIKGKISKAEFDTAAIRLLQSNSEDENLKKRILNSLYDLQNFGYIDYDAEHGALYINKTSLVVKPTDSGTTMLLVGARDNKFVQNIIEYSKKGGCYIDVQDNKNSLLPQTILIKFKKCTHTIVKDFAKHFKLEFKNEEQLFTQFALANSHKLADWLKFVNKTSSLNLAIDFEGGEIFDIEILQFKEKQNDFDKGMAFLRFQNIGGYKTVYRLWYKNEAYQISELHYGIYLFLYLYRQLQTEKHKNEKEQGLINTYEYNDKELFVKKLTNVLLYDESKNWLGVPLNCALPKYFAVAFTLLSGSKAEIRKYNNRPYLIYKNVPFLFCNNSLVTTLHQQFDNNNKKQKIFQ